MVTTSSRAEAPSPTPRFHEKRESILAAAAALFNEHGVKGATLSDIAATLGLGHTGITYYFRRKEDLATACFLRAIAVHDTLTLEAAEAPTLAQRIERFFVLHAELLAAMETGRHPPLIQFNDVRALPRPQEDEVFAAYTNWFRRVRALLSGPQTLGWTRQDRNARAHLVVSVAHWVRAWIGRHETDDYPRIARRVSDVVLHGLAAGGSVWQAPPSTGTGGPAPAAGDTAEAFLRAATELVNEQGYRGASVEKIAARLHLTKGSFYHHHDTKDDLIAACFERSFALLREALQDAQAAGGTGWQRVCRAAASLVELQLSARGPLLRSTAISALPDRARRQQVRRTMQRITERFVNLLVDGMIDGSVRPHDPAVAAQVLAASTNAASELARWVPGLRHDDAAALYARPALQGLLCPA